MVKPTEEQLGPITVLDEDAGGTVNATGATIDNIGGVSVNEVATIPGGVPTAGEGKVWVRDDAPNVLIFTDDTGVDNVLGAGGEDLAATLAIGNITGANNIVVTDTQMLTSDGTANDGNNLIIEPAGGITSGGDLLIRGGPQNGASPSATAGAVFVQGGSIDAAATNGTPGAVNITGGSDNSSGGSQGGGQINIDAGFSVNGEGGDIIIRMSDPGMNPTGNGRMYSFSDINGDIIIEAMTYGEPK